MITVRDVFAHGSPHWEIRTANATLLFDRTGGAFSEMRDADGMDWIQFDNCGAPVEYRGIPNLQVYKDRKYIGVFHPGYGTVRCSLAGNAPERVRIFSETEMNGRWSCLWDIYPCFMTCTVLEGNGDGFAFLYEGVPGGGGFDPETAFCMDSSGEKTYFRSNNFKPLWRRSLSPGWAYFGKDGVDRTLCYIRHGDSAVPSAMYQVFDALTVFGFGRDCEPGITQYPACFTVGFCESAEPAAVERHICDLSAQVSCS